MKAYDKEILTALYATLDYMMCNDIECNNIKKSINDIESKYPNLR